MTLYIDVIWFMNLCIDYLLLSLTALVLKRRVQRVRIIIGAFFASLIVLILFSPLASFFFQPWIKFLYSALIVLITFGFKRTSYYVQGLLMFYFVTTVTGGGLFALHFFWQTEIDIMGSMTTTNKGYYGSGISWVFIMIGFPLVWYFGKKRFETIEWKKIQYDQIVDVDITICGQTFRTKGLIDSGNQLTDPLTKKPVMIMEAKTLYPYFNKESIDYMMTLADGGGDEKYADQRLVDRAAIIPYSVIGQTSSFLCGIRPDKVIIYYLENQYETTNVIVGLQQQELSPEGAFNSIIHPKLVLGQFTGKLA